MKIDAFTRCFKELCLAFDLDYEKKKTRISTYFNSKLGEISEFALMELIKRAKETLKVKIGFLPPIRELVSLYYTTATNLNKPKLMTDRENFHDAICPICDGTGFVTLEHDGYIYSGFCCTCIIGQKKQHETTIGQELGCYKNWLDKGYKLHEFMETKEEVPF